MKLKRTLMLTGAAILCLTLVTACGGKNIRSGTSSDAVKAISSAQASVKKMKALGWQWRDAEKNLKKAKAAKKKGDNGVAIKLAKSAKSQAELAIQQYHYEKTINRSVKSKRRRARRRKSSKKG